MKKILFWETNCKEVLMKFRVICILNDLSVPQIHFIKTTTLLWCSASWTIESLVSLDRSHKPWNYQRVLTNIYWHLLRVLSGSESFNRGIWHVESVWTLSKWTFWFNNCNLFPDFSSFYFIFSDFPWFFFIFLSFCFIPFFLFIPFHSFLFIRACTFIRYFIHLLSFIHFHYFFFLSVQEPPVGKLTSVSLPAGRVDHLRSFRPCHEEIYRPKRRQLYSQSHGYENVLLLLR